jgi:hypothetical protein
MSLWMARLSLSNSSLLSLSRCSWRVIDLPTARDALPPTPPPPDQATILALLCLALVSSSSVDDCGAPACCCPTAPASPSPGLTPKIPPYAAASAMALPATRLYFLSWGSLLVPGFHRLPPHAPQVPLPPPLAGSATAPCCSVNSVDQQRKRIHLHFHFEQRDGSAKHDGSATQDSLDTTAVTDL